MLVFFFFPEIYCQYMFLGLLGVFIPKREELMNNKNKKKVAQNYLELAQVCISTSHLSGAGAYWEAFLAV